MLDLVEKIGQKVEKRLLSFIAINSVSGEKCCKF